MDGDAKTTMRQGSIRDSFDKRGHDLYETPACATRALIKTGVLEPFRNKTVVEPCAGRGAISRELRAAGFRVIAEDLIDYPGRDFDVYPNIDFFKAAPLGWAAAIVTNPPFRVADKFIRRALKFGLPTIVLLRLMALEGARRSDVLDHLDHLYIGIERLPMMHRDGWTGAKLKEAAMPFGWFVFLPKKRKSDTFTASRISWREEDQPCQSPSIRPTGSPKISTVISIAGSPPA